MQVGGVICGRSASILTRARSSFACRRSVRGNESGSRGIGGESERPRVVECAILIGETLTHYTSRGRFLKSLPKFSLLILPEAIRIIAFLSRPLGSSIVMPLSSRNTSGCKHGSFVAIDKRVTLAQVLGVGSRHFIMIPVQPLTRKGGFRLGEGRL